MAPHSIPILSPGSLFVLAGTYYLIDIVIKLTDDDFLDENILFACLFLGIFMGYIVGQMLKNVFDIILMYAKEDHYRQEDMLLKYYELYRRSQGMARTTGPP